MTKDEKQYFDKLARLGCILCHYLELGESPAEIHHCRNFGGLRKLSPVIPLCPAHHRGNEGVHGLGKKAFARKYGIDELGLLEYLKTYSI